RSRPADQNRDRTPNESVCQLSSKSGLTPAVIIVRSETQTQFHVVQFVVDVLDLAAQVIPVEAPSLIFPIDAIHFSGNVSNFAARAPIGPVSSHLPLHMREHAVDMVDLGCCPVVSRRRVLRTLVVTVFVLLVRKSRNASQTQSEHND